MPNSPPKGTIVDLNVIVKRIGRLKKLLQENQITTAKTLSTSIVANLGTVNTLIQAATTNQNLSTDPTLNIQTNP